MVVSRLVFSLSLFALAAPGAGETWKLATDDTAIEISVGTAQPLDRDPLAEAWPVVRRLGAVGETHNWLTSPATVPLMTRAWVGRKEVPLVWRFVRARMDPRGEQLTLVFVCSEPGLWLRSFWRARPGRGPVEHWMEIENDADVPVALGHQDSLTLRGLSAGSPAEVWWIRRGGGNASTQGGTFHEPVGGKLDLRLASNCEDGASPVPWLAVQAGTQRGLYVGWQFSGPGLIHAKAGDRPECIDLEVGNHPEFRTDVAPGETFLVPPAMVGCYRGDLDEGSYRLHRFVLEKLRPALPAGVPDPILAYNLYLDVGGNQAFEADVLRSAKTCRELGFEAFMPDAMWFPETGDWRFDPRRFPRGAGPIESFVHAAGMRMALWCAWTNGGVSAAPGALAVRGPQGRPDWFNADYAADWKPGPFYGARLCLASREAKRWAIEKTQWLVDHHKLDYLKHDIGPIVTQCNKKSHRHHYGVDAGYWAAMGYYEVQEKLLAAYPHLILENCSGGGHIKDFGVVRRTHYTVTTDTLSNLPNRQSIYDSTFALPPLVLQAYTYDNYYPVPGDGPGTFLWRSAMMGAWQIDPTDTPKWTEDERQSARRSAQLYKDWIRPLLADVKVHHVLPRPDGLRWDGMFLWSPSRRKGTFYVFRPGSPDEEQTVRLAGLDPAGRYWVWCEDGSVRPGQRTGAELMQPGLGLTIRLPAQYTSDLIFVQDASLGKPPGLDHPGVFRLKEAKVRAGMFSVAGTFSWEPAEHARSYRVTVRDPKQAGKPVAVATTSGQSVTLDNLPPQREFLWSAEAIGWGGTRTSDGPPGVFVTPRLNRPEGIAFLSDLAWVKATAGADNPVRRDVNYYGRSIAIAGKSYAKGLWTHAFPDATPADVVVDLTGLKPAWLKAEAGLDDQSGGGSVEFQVLVDGVVKAASPVLRPRQVHRFRVELTGAKQVTLRVLNGGDGHTCDHAAWGFARLVQPGVKDPLDY